MATLGIRIKPIVRVESIIVYAASEGSNPLTSGELHINNRRYELFCDEDGTLSQQFPIRVEISPITNVEIWYKRIPLPWYKIQRIDAQRLLEGFAGRGEQELSVDGLEDGIQAEITVRLVKLDYDFEGETRFPRPGKFPNLFALLIGIDNYVEFQLSGAVSAAKAMNNFLQESLEVPESHICVLLDAQATHSAIANAFQDIQYNNRIETRDPILILFAGHVEQHPLSSGETGDKGKIHHLFLHDQGDAGSISGYEIGNLIGGIARAKGNNITLVLDTIVANDRNNDPDGVTEGLAEETGVFFHHRQTSHVALASYVNQDVTRERDLHAGLFTHGLLKVLKSCIEDGLTYAQVLELVERVHKQRYRCIGINQHRSLFDAEEPAGCQVHYPTQFLSDDTYIIGAGLAHGISAEAEFSLYDDQGQCLGISAPIIGAIEDFQTTVTSSMPLKSVSFAVLTRLGKVPVYLAPGRNCSTILRDTLQRMAGRGGSNAPNFRLVEDATQANIHVEMENDQVFVTVLDPQVQKPKMKKRFRTVTLNRFTRVLHAATRYCWYLHHKNRNHLPETDHGVVVNFYRLENSSQSDSDGYDVPIKIGLCQKDPTPMIEFVPDSDANYGIELTNNTPRDLYLNVFYFGSRLNTEPWHLQSCAGEPEVPPLERNGTLDLTPETIPRQFSTLRGRDVSTACLKLFFSTRPVDLSDIVQISPFEDADDPFPTDIRGRNGGAAPDMTDPQDHTWFTMEIPVVLRQAL